MLFQLPTFQATLNPCSVSRAAFSAHPQGSYCGHCQRVVQDFSQSADPVSDLAAARAASPDGRVCGRFGAAQVQRPKLTRRLRWFVVALVLVVAQGLSAREALAQVRRQVPHKAATPARKHAPVRKPKPVPEQVPTEAFYEGGIELFQAEEVLPLDSTAVYTYVDQMPELPGGGGLQAIVAYIQQRVRWPQALRGNEIDGRVFASFVVGKDGQVRDAKIAKGLDPLLDAETLRVVQALPAFTPGRQGGVAVAVSFTVPVRFKLE